MQCRASVTLGSLQTFVASRADGRSSDEADPVPPGDMTFLLVSGIDARFIEVCLKMPTLAPLYFKLTCNVAERHGEINSAYPSFSN